MSTASGRGHLKTHLCGSPNKRPADPYHKTTSMVTGISASKTKNIHTVCVLTAAKRKVESAMSLGLRVNKRKIVMELGIPNICDAAIFSNDNTY